MNKKDISKILSEVKDGLNYIFKNEMLFGFVCGGFAKGYADKNHDIDIFVCIKNKMSKKKEKEYLKWYIDIHKKYNVKPDYNYPGEIITYSELIKTLSILEDLKLSLIVESIETKKAIIWADMIAGKTSSETGSKIVLLKKLKLKYRDYPDKWKKEILSLISIDEKREWENKNYLLIMERFMKYPKHDARTLNKKDIIYSL